MPEETILKGQLLLLLMTSLDGLEGLGYDKTNHDRWYDADAMITAELNYDETRLIWQRRQRLSDRNWGLNADMIRRCDYII
ncbi:hypothetical protein A0U42_09755 [Megasphaera sp. DISK 18]|nr:hypothetical protein A0U42_09755 [Megasphaera sp. DISK 18]